jgi:peptide/nickel transport system substrate-binding protein
LLIVTVGNGVLGRWRRPGRLRLLPILALVAMVLAACGGAASDTPAALTTATLAEQPNSNTFYVFPLTPPNIGSLYNITQFQNLLYPPLYWFGDNGRPVLNPSLSLADPPRLSDGGRVATITLKHWEWSDGQPVTSRDVEFWIQLLKAEKQNWSAYVPGDFPDNVASVSIVNDRTFRLRFTKAYGAEWLTYNELSQIIPIPAQIWDKTSPNGKVGNFAATTAGARAVYRFLIHEANDYATYATNPLWKVVDGPFEIGAFSTTGRLELVANPHYSGPVRPEIHSFIEEPFTSDAAEVDQLLAGKLDEGYLPPEDLALEGRLRAEGYRVVPTYSWSINFIPLNFHNPTVGPLFRQRYLRQAMQSLVDQPGIIASAYHGDAAPTYGPVPIEPANPFVTATERRNPLPYDPARAVSLLRQHGWTVRPDGVSTCDRPGDGSTECGPGVAAGARLAFTLVYLSGIPSLKANLVFLQTAFARAGIQLTLKGAPLAEVNSTETQCTPSQATCSWEMVDGALAWTYLPDYYPTGGELFATGAGSNGGSYSNTSIDRLIRATHHAGVQALDAYENAVARAVPVLWQPVAATLTVVKADICGTEPNDPFFNPYPENWRRCPAGHH